MTPLLAGVSDAIAELDHGGHLLAYLVVVMLVAGDAVFPVLPGETTVITAATMASEGNLNIGLVFIAAWLGAMIGDVFLYSVGRAGSERIQARVARTIGEDRLESGRYFFGKFGRPFLVVGRFIPGLRIVTALTAGSLQMPFRRYFPAELLGAGLWAMYASALGYMVGTQLDGNIWLSIAVASIATIILSAIVAVFYKRAEAERKRSGGQATPDELTAI